MYYPPSIITCSLELYRYRRAWTQCETGRGNDAGTGQQHEPVTLGHVGDDELHLGGGEAAADAAAGATAKGEIREGRVGSRARGAEALGVEALGRFPDRRMTVGEVRAQQHERAGGDGVAAERVILDRCARGEPGRWIESEDLFDHSARVAEARESLHARGPTAQDRAAFFNEPSHRVGMV